MNDYVIIVAGGKGLRMGGDVPKQFLPVGGRPVLMRTLERFHQYNIALKIILVLPKAQQDYWLQLCRQYEFHIPYRLADGGETRFHSVQNGLALIPDDAEAWWVCTTACAHSCRQRSSPAATRRHARAERQCPSPPS